MEEWLGNVMLIIVILLFSVVIILWIIAYFWLVPKEESSPDEVPDESSELSRLVRENQNRMRYKDLSKRVSNKTQQASPLEIKSASQDYSHDKAMRINTHDLVPYNLSAQDKKIMREFYNP